MQGNILDIVYGVLFHPVETFRQADYQKPYKLPLILVLFAALFMTILNNDSFGLAFFAKFFLTSFNIICYWLFFSFFVDLMARMFDFNDKYPKLLTLISFSFMPWMFLAPLRFIKNISEYIDAIAVLALLGVWLWTVALQIVAISETYEIPRKNAIIILLIPFIGMILYFVWVVDFFQKLFQIAGL